ncbi:MAG: 1,4-dihydroxy-2-naphthoate polyprenyltransferase [Desulfopila sp.]
MQRQNQLTLWWLAIRPKTLPAAVAPIAVGAATAFYDDVFAALPVVAALIAALVLQVGVNLANDYFDAQNDIDSGTRLGPVRVTQSGLIPPARVKGMMIGCLVVAAAVFGYLTSVGGVVLFWVGVASLLGTLGYSGGPYPLASHGLGELFVFIFFGLVAVGGTYWAQAVTITPLVVAASFPPGLLITAIMVVNNLRDRGSDALAGKNTLAVRLGEKRTIGFYRSLLAGSYLVVVLLAALAYGWPVLLPLAVTPLARALWREIGRARGPELNDTLAQTARFALFFSFLLAFGIFLCRSSG